MNNTNIHLLKIVTVFLCLFVRIAYAQVITTIASGTNIGDGGPALNAGFCSPIAIAFDQKGNSFILDTDDYRVRKIDANGIITTLAGNGELGFGGDNIPATSAGFIRPLGVAVDATGRVYIADTQNNRVRRIDLNGIITTVAGNGAYGFSGDGGPAVNAPLGYPVNVAIDKDDNLYIVDENNSSIRKVGVDGIIHTVAGNGTAGFSGDGGPATSAQLQYPSAVAVDNSGNLYIADCYNKRIRKVDANGIITTLAGNGSFQVGGDGGLAVNTPLYFPGDVAVDAIGIVYLSQQDGRVRKIGTDGIIQPVAGNGTNGFSGDGGLAVNALIGSISGVDIDASGNIYISDQNNYRIRRITSDGIINTVAGGFTGDGGNATNAFFRKLLFKSPANLTVDTKGNVYVADRFSNRLRKVSPNGIITTVAGTGVNGYAGDGGPATEAQLQHPRGIGLDSTGNLYTVDQYNTRLRKIATDGTITTVAGNGTPNFIENRLSGSSADIYNSSGMAVSKAGTVYVPTSNCILKITTAGIISIIAGTTASSGYSGDGGLAINAQLIGPSSVTLDKDENLYIVDGGNNRVRKIDANGIITTVAGNGSRSYGGENILATNSPVNNPYEVAFDATGVMYISESGYSRIRKVDRNGIITTAAGNSSTSFSGDGGLAINAGLAYPGGITVDAVGNLYIADTENRRIRKVTYPIRPTLTYNQVITCLPTSVTLTAQPSGTGFAYQFSPGAVQIGTTNQAVVSNPGLYSVTVTTSIFGSPAGSATASVSPADIYTVKAGDWNDSTIWSCGAIPIAGQRVRILHVINLPLNYQAEVKAIQYGMAGNLNVATGAQLRLAP